MITKVNNHSPFTVKKSELKSGAAWNQMAQDRFIKQHGSVDHIPEGDNHAVPVFDEGPTIPKPTEEEMHSAVSSLEEQINKLKDADKNRPVSPSPAPKNEPVKDDFYDDWIE